MTSAQRKLLRDPDRLAEIAALGLAGEDLDPAFDGFAARAAEALGRPIGLVSIVLDDTQYLVGLHGLEGTYFAAARGTPVEWSYCRHTVEQRVPFLVGDALSEPLVSQSPVTQLDGVRSYAGVPLVTSTGQAIGSLCVLDKEQGEFSPEQVAVLEALAAEVLARLERRRLLRDV